MAWLAMVATARRSPWIEIASWVPVGLIPIVNGALRMALYARWLGEPLASLSSSALDVLAVGAYACLVQRRWPVETWHGAVGRGLLWISLTTLDHFGLGAFVFGISWPALAAKYDLLAGETWPLVSLAIFAAPAFARWKLGSPGALEASVGGVPGER